VALAVQEVAVEENPEVLAEAERLAKETMAAMEELHPRLLEVEVEAKTVRARTRHLLEEALAEPALRPASRVRV
jgi:hypothetical protein